ncbi:MAG: saccharopine dehydrogenase NADP-binding domain-containing protein [Burkholderiaceae bacterium]|nr:saccharopine dehydrogenase NADP-binding domain-containing protein [Burkholderiales bacterium]MCZ8102381.1 saccharopine dehydrogenase NADP-binding domain-containing protein [Burkholderiales bacterium]MCZ8339506.1 saccharopine dehydrogenase NADP-binding domain-containing protein [Burkholderiaceae bacterium]
MSATRVAAARSPRRRAAGTRAFDVVLYGATGFVGRQTVEHFAAHAPRGLRWALAGRSAERLERVREACGPGAADAGIVVADARDADALGALAADARVVLSTAGPFALYGDALVDACVVHRTHYVDITGETPWVRRLIDRHHARAAADGTRIVPCCGFDSVPSDLGAWLVASAIRERFDEPCVEVRACFSMRGGVNGGTLASALNLMDAGEAERFADPFLLNPPGTAPRGGAAHADPALPVHDPDFDAWLGPFVMGPVNTRVVRRSAALLAARDASAYDRDFRYQEYLRVGRGRVGALAATGLAVGFGVGRASMRFAPARALARRLVPAPGEGPSEASMDGGSFRCELVGRSAGGHLVRGRIAGRGDPGNRATTVFVCEATLALAGPADMLPGIAGTGGVLTPATALGDVLARRLAAAGMTVEPLPG